MGEVFFLTRAQILAGHSRRAGLHRVWLDVDDATYRALCEMTEVGNPTETLRSAVA